MLKKIKIISCLLVSLSLAGNILFVSPILIANAADSIVDTSNAGYANGTYTLNDLVYQVIRISQLVLGIVGSLALIMFIYGGFMFLVSSGSQDKITKAKDIIVAAVIGLIIVFSSYMIIQYSLGAIGITDWTGAVPTK